MDACFHRFQADISEIELPEAFTFPFYYQAHELSKIAAQELQSLIESQTWEHNFGLQADQKGLVIGKMFGILVVENDQGEIGYLAGFSGKLAESNHHNGFVPPVFDMLEEDGFFKTGEIRLNQLNKEIEQLENSEEYKGLKLKLETVQIESQNKISDLKARNKRNKEDRKIKRIQNQSLLSEKDFNAFEEELKKQSIHESYELKKLNKECRENISDAKEKLENFKAEIKLRKEERKEKSNRLQQQLFDQYHFLNAHLESKSVLRIFNEIGEKIPPAGSGECAAPKLLQYAYLKEYKPIALAEFWWGASPKSEIRKHKNFYPSCRSKCEPILGHMLQGLNVEQNPMLQNPAEGKEIEVIFEDDFLAVINKPEEFLSVPGKNITDSVQTRMEEKYPESKGHLIVHRLDMSTSGLMLIAKTKRAHEKLQKQFLKKTIKKRYVSLLEGKVKKPIGIIELPLRVDLDNRPQQLVCYEHGKPAKTEYEVISIEGNQTRIRFYPITGRTHQLRVHAAHSDGLNCPIVGDDLYGNRGERLCLHAERIEFVHPVSKDVMVFQVEAGF